MTHTHTHLARKGNGDIELTTCTHQPDVPDVYSGKLYSASEIRPSAFSAYQQVCWPCKHHENNNDICQCCSLGWYKDKLTYGHNEIDKEFKSLSSCCAQGEKFFFLFLPFWLFCDTRSCDSIRPSVPPGPVRQITSGEMSPGKEGQKSRRDTGGEPDTTMDAFDPKTRS